MTRQLTLRDVEQSSPCVAELLSNLDVVVKQTSAIAKVQGMQQVLRHLGLSPGSGAMRRNEDVCHRQSRLTNALQNTSQISLAALDVRDDARQILWPKTTLRFAVELSVSWNLARFRSLSVPLSREPEGVRNLMPSRPPAGITAASSTRISLGAKSPPTLQTRTPGKSSDLRY